MDEERWAAAMKAERRGDTIAYEAFLKDAAMALRKIVRGKLAQFGLGTNETEDIVQEILIGIHTKRHSWDDTRPFMPWFYAVARYKLLDGARKIWSEGRVMARTSVEDLAEILEAPEADWDRNLLDLDRHLSGLPGNQQKVVRAIAIDGASVREAATQLNISEGSVRVMFHRALQRLKGVTGRERSRSEEP